MLCVLTVRRLKPGSYEDFRKAWQPDHWLPFASGVRIMRSPDDPDEVAAFGFVDMTVDELEKLRDEPEFLASETARIERINAYEEAIVLNTIYEVVEEVPAAGDG